MFCRRLLTHLTSVLVAFLILAGSLSLVANNVALPRAGEADGADADGEDGEDGEDGKDARESKNLRGELDEQDDLIPRPRPWADSQRHEAERWSIDTLAGRFALLSSIPRTAPRLAVRRQI